MDVGEKNKKMVVSPDSVIESGRLSFKAFCGIYKSDSYMYLDGYVCVEEQQETVAYWIREVTAYCYMKASELNVKIIKLDIVYEKNKQ